MSVWVRIPPSALNFKEKKMTEMVFRLNEKQVKRLERWKERVITPEIAEAMLEETCCIQSPITFSFRDAGITTIVKARMGKHELDLTLDDDGEFMRW